MFDGERSLGVVVAYGDLVCCVVKDGKVDLCGHGGNMESMVCRFV